MRALRIQHDNATLAQRPDPAPSDDQTLVRVTNALVAATDPPRWTTELTPGHRFVGHIVSSQDESIVGARVVADADAPDPSSELARKGFASLDPQRDIMGVKGLEGCLSEFAVIPTRSVRAVA